MHMYMYENGLYNTVSALFATRVANTQQFSSFCMTHAYPLLMCMKKKIQTYAKERFGPSFRRKLTICIVLRICNMMRSACQMCIKI